MKSETLREYQQIAVGHVFWAYSKGFRRVCVVSPTGSGKTRIGVELAARFARPGLWLAHRTELIKQAAERLRAAGLEVGIISPDFEPTPEAPVQVASLDTLAARGIRPPAEWICLDECHHAPARTYAAILDSYDSAWIFGLTATPERGDGKPLTGQFDYLVVAANYSELLAAGHIAECRVISPEAPLGADLAQCPLAAYQALAAELGEQPLTIAFARSVKAASAYAVAFKAAGVAAAVITGETPAADRADIFARFKTGELRVLWNVQILTEGTDMPAARVCLLARGVQHTGAFLQIVGRVLRAHPGKPDAILLDLSGASRRHLHPTADREYSLHGRAIRAQRTADATRQAPRVARPTVVRDLRLREMPARQLRAAPRRPIAYHSPVLYTVPAPDLFAEVCRGFAWLRAAL